MKTNVDPADPPISDWSPVTNHIRQIVETLTRNNYKTHMQDLLNLERVVEPDILDILLIKNLMNQIDWRDSKKQKDQARLQLLSEKLHQVCLKPNFVTIISQGFEEVSNLNENFLPGFVRLMKLNLSNEVALALGLANSTSENISWMGIKHLQQQISVVASGNEKLPDFILHKLIVFILEDGTNFPNKDNILESLRKVYGQNLVSSPILDPREGVKGDWQRDPRYRSNQFIEGVEKSFSLAALMQELGYGVCSTKANLKKVLSQIPTPTASSIAEVIGMMVATSHEVPGLAKSDGNEGKETKIKGWNLDVFVSVISELLPSLNWKHVVDSLDYNEFRVYDQKGLDIILEIYQKATRNFFPTDYLLLRKWKNTEGQWSFIRAIILSPQETVRFSPSPTLLAALEGLPISIPKNLHIVQSFLSLPLIIMLLHLSLEDSRISSDILKVFQEGPVKHCPGVLMIGLALINKSQEGKKDYFPLYKELLQQIMNIFLTATGYPSPTILIRVWEIDQTVLIDAMLEFYLKDPSSISRMLNIAQDIKKLRPILDSNPLHHFSIDLAALAYLREHLNLEKWIEEMIEQYRDNFCKSVISFLKDRLARQRNSGSENEKNNYILLSPDAVQVFLKGLRKAMNDLSPSTQEELRQLGGTPEEIPFPPDIENEADRYYREIYTGQISINEIINLLQNFKSSTNTREQKIYQCMIKSLFDEYKFFPKYPEKELQITGVLFGSLVQHGLVTNVPLGIALRCVLEALKKPPGSKMIKFGFLALEQFKNRLSEWPPYCVLLLQIPTLQQLHPYLYKHIQECYESVGKQQQTNLQIPRPISPAPPSPIRQMPILSNPPMPQPKIPNPQTPVKGQSATLTRPFPPDQGIIGQQRNTSAMEMQYPKNTGRMDMSDTYTYSPRSDKMQEDNTDNQIHDDTPDHRDEHDLNSQALPINTLLSSQSQVLKPDEDVVDTIHFIFNNVSVQNLDKKVEDLKSILAPEYQDYLAQYVVIKRVSVEENNHELYMDFILRLNLKTLNNKILSQACDSVKALMASERIRIQSERSILKNLGNWIGLLTIARDKPLRFRDLSLKDILLRAYEEGKLIAAVPFVSKVLSKGAQSRFFKPPNPWVMGIFRLLVEIYQLQNLKLSLRFEVEILADQTLHLKISDVQPSDLLSKRSPYSGPGPITDFEDLPPEPMSAKRFPLEYIHINPSIPLFNQQPNFKKAVYLSINKAIQDMIGPVLDRAVGISAITAKELVLKDFSMEPDEMKMQRAAICMAQSLAGSLAAQTSKEPLRTTITNNLRAALSRNVMSAHMEPAILAVVADNLDLACGAIQKAAAEAVVGHVQEHLRLAVEERKNHREKLGGKGQPYYDIKFVGSSGYTIVSTLPENLRPKMGGVTPQQMQVYEDFLASPVLSRAQFQRDVLLTSGGQSHPAAPEGQLKELYALRNSNTMGTSQAPLVELLTTEQASRNVDQLILDICNALPLIHARSLSELSQESVILMMLSRISDVISSSQNRYDVALYAAQQVFDKMFEERSQLVREVFVSFTRTIVSVCPKVRQKVTEVLINSDNSRKLHPEVVPALILFGILEVSEYDAQLAKQIAALDRKAIDFSIYLIQTLVKSNNMIGFTLTFRELEKVATSPDVQNVLEGARRVIKEYSAGDFGIFSKSTPEALEQKALALYEDWLTLYTHPNQGDKAMVYPQYIQQLQQRGFYGSSKDTPSESEIAFYRVSTKITIERCVRSKEAQDNKDGEKPKLNYKPVDALAKLISLMVKYFPEKILIIHRILGVIAGVMERDYNAAPLQFDQRAYCRLFTSLLMEFNTPDPVFEPHLLSLLLEFRDLFYQFRPANYPGFTFAWLELISHRMFMPKLLNDQSGWEPMKELMMALFQFLDPHLRTAKLTSPIRILYQGTLRVLLVLLHDFPEFLCDYHFSFCNAIPATCIQMRNLILSAFPHTMQLPDPFTRNLKVDLLPEIKEPPRIRSDYTSALVRSSLKAKLENYLRTSTPKTFLTELIQKIQFTNPTDIETHGTKYDVPLINSLVLFTGSRALADTGSELMPLAPIEVFTFLAENLDTEGRYYLFNAIANQLRFPNNHTYYFSCVLLCLFAEAQKQEIIQEQITRVLVERLMVHRPHPWGLLITFIELMKNPRYNFRDRNFTRCAPEIERLFVQVGTIIYKNEQAQ